MKLKNFIKKKKSSGFPKKPFFSNSKKRTKPTRAEEKIQGKKNRRALAATTISILIFISAVCLFGIAFFYNRYVTSEIEGGHIELPGETYILQIEEADKILRNNGIEFDSIEYASTSGQLTMRSDSVTVLYSLEKDFVAQVQSYKKIQRALVLADKSARVIDLRYNRPIVNY